MELKPGYKQTEVGVIPKDWNIKEINQICTPSKVRINPLTAIINYKCIELEHLSQGTGQLLGFADSNQLKSQKTVFKTGDVLFGKLRPYLKKYFFPEFDGVCTTEIWVLHASLDVVNRWLYFIVQSDRFLDIANQSTGTKMPRAEWPIVRKALIPLPSTKTEQTAIANALSDADALIQSLTRLIAKKRQIKQGAMQTLLNPYENGRLKEGWVVKKLGDVGVFAKGSGVRKDETQSGSLPCIRYGEIYTRHNDYIKKFHSFISNDIAKTAKQLKKGDLLFAGSGETKEEIGKCVAFLNENVAFAGGDIVILSPISVDSLFFGYYLNTNPINKQKASMGQGDAVVHISATALANIDITVPEKSIEQNRIATILSGMDTEIAALETKLAKYQHIKQGMMQNLLTGRIRLVEPETKTGAGA